MQNTISPETLQTWLPDVIKLAQEAGSAIMAIYQDADLGTTQKEDKSPLTNADLASHQTIVKGLQGLTPEIPILSEEAKALPYEERRTWPAFWLVDPLDGTKEFIQRNGQFTVNIALVQGGSPVLGVVYAPAIKVSYWGAQGYGAFKQEEEKEAVRIQTRAYPEATITVVASRSHAGPETEAFLQKLQAAYADKSVELISMGSSLKLCLVAEGVAHLYPRFGPTMEWDTAAAQAVVEQAGGRVTNLQGDPLQYNKENLLNPFFMVAGQSVKDLWPHLT
jgi:3'(2'), 5'-bisphosphate nucleotidase